MQATTHPFGDHAFAFNAASIHTNREMQVAVMRVAADFIEQGAEIDMVRLLDEETLCLYFVDAHEAVASFVVLEYETETHCWIIRLAWTSPSFREMGLFKTLMNTAIKLVFSHKKAPLLRSNPPVSNPIFDAALAKMGFAPLSRVTEYRPFKELM